MQSKFIPISMLVCILILGLAAASQASKCKDPFAIEIVDSTPIVDKMPEDILHAPDGVAADFDSDGRTPSTVIVKFASDILNREGNDFSITYWDLPESQRHETSEVLVKTRGYDFTVIGVIKPTPGLEERHVSQVAFFDLDELGWDRATQVMVRNLRVRSGRHEGLDIDGFTSIYCEHDAPPSNDHIALKTSGLKNTKATCWNTTNNDLVPAGKDGDGNHTCAHLFADQGDSISLTVFGESTVRQ